MIDPNKVNQGAGFGIRNLTPPQRNNSENKKPDSPDIWNKKPEKKTRTMEAKLGDGKYDYVYGELE